MNKEYVFDYDNHVYRIFTSTLILNGFDAFLLQVKSLQDYDDYLAAHRIEDNTWYEFDALGSRGNNLEVFRGFPQDFLNGKLDYVNTHDFPPLEEQSYIHKMRSLKLTGMNKLYHETIYPVDSEPKSYFDTPKLYGSYKIRQAFKKLKGK